MIRIGVDAHILTGKYQGSRTYLAELLARIGGLDRANEYVLYSHDPDYTRSQFRFANYSHRALPETGSSVRLIAYWPYAVWSDRLDMLWVQYIGPPFAPVRSLVTVHDLLFESHPQFFPFVMRWRNKLLVRQTARAATAILVDSEFTRSELITRYRIDPARVHLTSIGYTPLQAPLAGPQPQDEYGRYILMVGRLEPRKNLGLLLDAFSRLQTRGVKLVVVGREDYGVQLEMRRMRNTPGVVHLQDIATDVLTGLYRNAAVFAFPSAAEGFGIPVLEALAAGTQVVCSDQTALPEVGGPFVRYFNPMRPDAATALAAQIDAALSSPKQNDPTALRQHLARFDWESSAQHVVDAIAKAALY